MAGTRGNRRERERERENRNESDAFRSRRAEKESEARIIECDRMQNVCTFTESLAVFGNRFVRGDRLETMESMKGGERVFASFGFFARNEPE